MILLKHHESINLDIYVLFFSQETYLIATKTGSSVYAGTDDDVIISLDGAECRAAYTFLDNPGKKDFLRNHTDYFKKLIGYVGEVSPCVVMMYKINENKSI